MTDLVAHYSGQPAALAAILFIAPFVLEEAAILAAAGIATAGLLSPQAAFLSLLFGMVASDWFLFALGHLAIRVRRIRSWVGEARLAKGRELLGRGTLVAALTARLIPWLLPPIFIASSLVGVPFTTFAVANGVVAVIYTGVFFFLAYAFNAFLLDHFNQWGWIVMVGLAVMLLILSFAGRRKLKK